MAIFIAGAIVFNSFFVDVIEKMLYYLFEKSYTDVWEYTIGVLILFLFIILFLKFRRLDTYDFREAIPMSTGAVVAAVMSIVFINVFSLFYRLIGHIVPLLSIPMIMITLERSELKEGRFRQLTLQSIVLIFSIFILALSMSRGSMSSLKFFAFEG